MRSHHLIPAALAGATVLAAGVPAAEAAPHHAQVPPKLGTRLQAALDGAVGRPIPGVTLRVRFRDGRTWSGAAGLARLDPRTPMRPGDRFRAGSIMKTFISAVTLQLVEEGRFHLDDPITAVLPPRVTARFPEAGHITVRMLLDHTSGLAEYADDAFDQEVLADPRRVWTTDELLDRTAAMPRTGAPGAAFSYSNANYNLLGLIVQRATGRPWRALVRGRIFRPLHMTHSSLPAPGHPPVGRDIAHGYQDAGGRRYDLTHVDSSMAGAAGGHALLTTTADLSRFLRGLLGGRLFDKPATLREMRTLVPAPTDYGRTGYGLGIERLVVPGGVEMIGNMGGTAGYRAFMYRLPRQHVDLTMAMNSYADPTPALLPVLRVLATA